MKPEKKAPSVELNDDEKVLFELLKAFSPILLSDLKTKSGFSNKKWDKTLKGITKHHLAKVNTTDAGLFVELV